MPHSRYSRHSRRSDKESSRYTCDCPNGTSSSFSYSSYDTSGGWTPHSIFVDPNPSSSDSSTRRASRSATSSTSRRSSRFKSTANSESSGGDDSRSRGPFRTHRRTPVYTYDDPAPTPSRPSHYYDATTVFEGDTRWYLSLFSTDSRHRRVWYVFFPVSGQPTDAELVAHLQDCAAQVTDPMKALVESYEATGSGVWVEFATPCRSSPDQALRRLISAFEGLALSVARGGQLPIDAGPMYV